MAKYRVVSTKGRAVSTTDSTISTKDNDLRQSIGLSAPSTVVSTKDSAVSTKDSAVSTKDSLVSIKDGAVSTKDSIVSAKNSTVSTVRTKDSSVSTKDSSVSTNDSVVSTKDSIVSNKGSAVSTMDSTVSTMDSSQHQEQCRILVTDVVPSVASDLPSVAPNMSSNGTTPLPTTSSNDVTYKYYLFAEVPAAAFISVVITTMVLCLVAILLLGHLLCFHIYLMCNNLTTYDYIMRGREKAKKSSPESSQQNLKGNKVAPVAMISRDQGLHESMENGYVPENGYHHGSYDPNSSDEDTRQMQRQYEEVLMEDEALSPRLTARSSGRHRPTSTDRERQDSDLQQPIMMKKPKRNNASKERKMEVAAIAANGTYTPRGYHINPTLPPITPPAPAPRNDVITPARSPSPYHSSSAESLQEIPLATIRGTGEQTANFCYRKHISATFTTRLNTILNVVAAQDPERRAHSKRRKAKPKERRPRPLDVPPLELTQTVTDGEYSLRSDMATGHSGRPLPPLHMATSNV
ncbi:putative palmitoyltransferase zdhhc1 [Branchiostoma belcheri]|nr:putative palmitoyltransferase zdhhc1 [Branchiostoma belcheri]